MGFLNKALKGAVATKAISFVQREARKPENQRRARELFEKARNRGGRKGPGAY